MVWIPKLSWLRQKARLQGLQNKRAQLAWFGGSRGTLFWYEIGEMPMGRFSISFIALYTEESVTPLRYHYWTGGYPGDIKLYFCTKRHTSKKEVKEGRFPPTIIYRIFRFLNIELPAYASDPTNAELIPVFFKFVLRTRRAWPCFITSHGQSFCVKQPIGPVICDQLPLMWLKKFGMADGQMKTVLEVLAFRLNDSFAWFRGRD